MILDKDIPAAEPEEVLEQFTPLLYKILRRYTPLLTDTGVIDPDDLLQAGRVAIYTAQKVYNPSDGFSFLHFVFNRIRKAMRKTIGIKPDGSVPEEPLRLDEPIGEEDGICRIDNVPDPAPTAEERIIEQDTQCETTEAVHAALARMKSDKQREVITRVYLDGEPRETAAANMGMKIGALYSLDKAGRVTLRRDPELRAFAMPYFHVGVNRFRTTWTSATEAAVIWRDKRLHPEKYLDPDDVQTSTGTEAL